MSPRRPSAPLLPLLAGAGLAGAALVGFLLLTAVAPGDALTVVLGGGRVRAVAPGGRYLRPPGDRVVSVARSGAFRFPDEEAYRLLSRDGAEIPALFDVRYTLNDAGPLLDYLTRAGSGEARAESVRQGFISEVIGGAFREAARPVAAGLEAEIIYRTQGRALVEALTREVVLPRGVAVEVTLHALAMSATAQRNLVARSAGARARRILFIGIDAADWTLLDPLLAEGRLPNLGRLIRGGVRADLHTLTPMLSPPIWTTMATGVGPDRHGIPDFLVKDPLTGRPVPVTSAARRVPAFWNVATTYGRSVNVVGWPATFPAEPINGTLVSDRFGFVAHAAGQVRDAGAEGVVSPPSFLVDARRLTFRPDQLGFEKVSRFLDISRRELAAARTGGFRRGDPIDNFALTYATAETHRKIGVELLHRRADLTAVCFEFLDAMGHLFMPYAPPRRPGVSVAEFDRYRDAVKIACVEMDRMVGSLVEAAGDSTVVFIASNHGFLSGSRRPAGAPVLEAGQATRWHRDPGLLVLSGPGIRAGARVARASVLDIAPTLLHLAGLPVSREMEGRVLIDAFPPADLAAHPVRTIDRYRLSPDADNATRDDPAAGASAWVDLGISRLRQDDAPAAIQAFDRALGVEPGNVRALVNRGHACLRLGRTAQAESSFARCLALAPDEPNAHFGRGLVAAERKDYATARREFERALVLDPKHASARENLGLLRGVH